MCVIESGDTQTHHTNWVLKEESLKICQFDLCYFLFQQCLYIYDHCRAETVRSALDVLAVCSVMPRVQLLLCDRIDLPDEAMTVGMNIILGAAEGEIVADADVQRAALAVIINCVCAPIHRVGGSVGRFSVVGSAKKKTNNFRSSEELINKMWESVRSNNGIMVC